jgi:hypothetical protein
MLAPIETSFQTEDRAADIAGYHNLVFLQARFFNSFIDRHISSTMGATGTNRDGAGSSDLQSLGISFKKVFRTIQLECSFDSLDNLLDTILAYPAEDPAAFAEDLTRVARFLSFNINAILDQRFQFFQ